MDRRTTDRRRVFSSAGLERRTALDYLGLMRSSAIVITLLAATSALAQEARVVSRSRPGMGGTIQVMVWSTDAAGAEAAIDAALSEIDRIDALLSEGQPA